MLRQVSKSHYFSTEIEHSSKQQSGEFRQISTPHHPGVHAGRFDVGVLNAFRFQPLTQISIGGDEAVFGAAGNP
jgi:hypothetical protein